MLTLLIRASFGRVLGLLAFALGLLVFELDIVGVCSEVTADGELSFELATIQIFSSCVNFIDSAVLGCYLDLCVQFCELFTIFDQAASFLIRSRLLRCLSCVQRIVFEL